MQQGNNDMELYQVPSVPPPDSSPDPFFRARTVTIGRMATRAATNVRDFLRRDITAPSIGHRQVSEPTHIAKVPNDVKDLKKMVYQSKEMIARVQTIFPLTLFPDDIILDRTKVTIIKRNFFWSADVISIRIEDVLNVSSSIGPFFGSVSISSRVMNSVDHFEVDRLWRSDAIEIKKLIQGYMIAKHSDVALEDLPVDELVATLEDLGDDSSMAKRV